MADEDTVLSLEDVLDEDRELEDTANAVLGDSEDSECSYVKGYVGRQALYSCVTCRGEGGEAAGVCLACSLHCHEGHDVYELYTKRNFRCDCGSSKFPGFTCTLNPDKEPLNLANKYGHNFQGLYCSCNRPYPDSEDQVADEMIQCIICEDWFHSRHLRTEVPMAAYEEMSCDSCMQSHDFLHAYKLHTVPTKLEKEDGTTTDQHLEVENSGYGSKIEDSKAENFGSGSKTEDSTLENSRSGSKSEKTSIEGSAKIGSEPDVCELLRRRKALATASSSAMPDIGGQEHEGGGTAGKESEAGFFETDWRQHLCRCPSCMTLYESHKCVFLLEESDCLAAYEQRASSRPHSHDAAVAALGSMGRIQQVEAIEHFNVLKSELSDFLKGFADNKRVVSKRDIDGFFEGMNERKRQKLESQDGIPPANCHL